jgi:hypothetical protein
MSAAYEAGKDRRQPSKATRRAVKAAFDAEKLVEICARWDFADYGLVCVDLEPSKGWRGELQENFYWYGDRGSKILAVGHLDSVQQNPRCAVTETAAGLLATSGVLDDRLGVYVILDMLPKLGIKVDVLLTTNEEVCGSTARDFEPPEGKEYNWIIEFDRGGTDVVSYQYDCWELEQLVNACGAKMSRGSYSDIADLERLGVKGLNWGVGYQDYHGPRGHAWLEDTFRMVARFVKFWRANRETRLEHEPYVRGESRLAGVSKEWKWENGRWSWVGDSLRTGGNRLQALASMTAEYLADCGHFVDMDDETTFGEALNERGGWDVYCKAICRAFWEEDEQGEIAQ